MKISILTSIISLLLIFPNCKSFRKDNEFDLLSKTYQQFSERQLRFPDSVLVLYRENCIQKQSTKTYTGNQLKIVTYVNADCGRCVNNIKRWEEEIIKVIDTNFVKILIFIYTDDFSKFTNSIYPEISINYPLLIDTLNLFIINNDLPRFDERFQTFLIDENNAIILIGSPLYNRKMRALYMNEINKRIGS